MALIASLPHRTPGCILSATHCLGQCLFVIPKLHNLWAAVGCPEKGLFWGRKGIRTLTWGLPQKDLEEGSPRQKDWQVQTSAWPLTPATYAWAVCWLAASSLDKTTQAGKEAVSWLRLWGVSPPLQGSSDMRQLVTLYSCSESRKRSTMVFSLLSFCMFGPAPQPIAQCCPYLDHPTSTNVI